MSKLIYIANVSLDGYIEDAYGNFDFTEPSDDGFAFITDLIRGAGTYLYGRRLYETMAVWETEPALAAQSELRGDFARVWQAARALLDRPALVRHALRPALERGYAFLPVLDIALEVRVVRVVL